MVPIKLYSTFFLLFPCLNVTAMESTNDYVILKCPEENRKDDFVIVNEFADEWQNDIEQTQVLARLLELEGKEHLVENNSIQHPKMKVQSLVENEEKKETEESLVQSKVICFDKSGTLGKTLVEKKKRCLRRKTLDDLQAISVSVIQQENILTKLEETEENLVQSKIICLANQDALHSHTDLIITMTCNPEQRLMRVPFEDNESSGENNNMDQQCNAKLENNFEESVLNSHNELKAYIIQKYWNNYKRLVQDTRKLRMLQTIGDYSYDSDNLWYNLYWGYI